MSKLSTLTLIAILIAILLTAYVYVDIYLLFSVFFITIPLAVIAAIGAVFIAVKEQNTPFVLINILLAVIAIASFFIIPW